MLGLTRPDVRFRVLQTLVSRVPARSHAVVAGYPDDEGNSVEVVRGLAGRGVPVTWLVGDDPRSLSWLVDDAEGSDLIRCLQRDTTAAYAAYVTARYVFFTHGLYGSPQPPAHKTFVNLWHGDGPKRRKGFATVRSSLVVSGTRLWGQKRAESFGVREQDVLITGNPRVDQFGRPAGDERLRELGLDPTRPFLLWLPTYRRTEYRGNRIGSPRNWADTAELTSRSPVRSRLEQAARDADSLGLSIVAKPHPLDADEFAGTGLRVLTGAHLRSARVGLYQLLARAHGLVTDYSSVWTDYLAVDRPIGFYCPDLVDYVEGRGLNVDDYPALLPGPLLDTAGDFRSFLEHCLDEPPWLKAQRAASVERVGAVTKLGATQRLLDAVGVPPASR